MISNRAKKLLKWLKRKDRWMSLSEIKQKYKKFDDRAFNSIKDEKYIDFSLNSGAGEWSQYRINDAGIAYLQRRRRNWWVELRAWLTLAIAIAAFAQSVIALLLQS